MKRDLRIALMHFLTERDGHGWTCFYCGCDLLPYGVNDQLQSPVIEHKQPVKRGGTSEANNLVVACHHCNVKKGIQTHDEFITSPYGLTAFMARYRRHSAALIAELVEKARAHG